MTAVRTMVVWCLDWPVVAAGCESDDVAAVFVANRVVAASAAARVAGIERGLRRREAQRRCPHLLVFDRDEAREVRIFEEVVRVVERYTPRIEVTRPGQCAFATRGPSRYFGGDHALADLLSEAIADVLAGRTEVRIGVADGPFAAALAARAAQAERTGCAIIEPGSVTDFLHPLPVTALERPELTDVLLRLGLRTLGAFAALPATDVLGRFGVEGREGHRLANGLDALPPDGRIPPPDLDVSIELDPPIERVDQAAFVAKTLAEQLEQQLQHEGVACTRVAIEAETEHGELLVRLWRHEGALSAAAVADRVRWQLDGWLNAAPSARPSGGLIRLALVPDEVIAAAGRQLGFWGGETAADERAARAFARVQGLLGPDAVRVPEWSGGRQLGDEVALVSAAAVDLAERSLRPVAADAGSIGVGVEAPWPGRLPRPAPSLLHASPLLVDVLDAAGDAVHITGRGLASAAPRTLVLADRRRLRVTAWAGPWLVEERWWDADRSRRQARFQIVTDDGGARVVMRESGQWWEVAAYD
ncbi:MAG: DNA polymerase Y family protein [Acidimicrobiales bacterium]|nr:DNA polymerase Y family protein [Acidimicrobiales bacterium]